ncbi:TrmH family RNA methyltransferase [Consotaella salsifontis]|uniref:tRNA G18 (Ribose-2'-O)-methylase SpoU n=1 Tax=Consotaella salsifontis TaxID=1365950 RepID=A0A1T4RDT6_9HYPH|nr:RNA methyltransferase [Consotaella salsifontis]SKA14190.1 tRNA G18 (ribose-2'-O)-methylase SpoU [Consotaella salsifontis]
MNDSTGAATRTSPVIAIDNPEDERISVFRNVRERDVVGRNGFIAEGTVVLERLLASPHFRPTCLLILKNRLAGIEPLLHSVPADVPIYIADRSVMNLIAGFPVHRGVLAHGEPAGADPGIDVALASLAVRRKTVVCLIGLANHDNMGAVFRNAAAFEAGAVLIDRSCCDPFYRKAIRVSVGQVFHIPILRFETPAEMLAALMRHGFEVLALTPRGGEAVSGFVPNGATALVLGTEGEGLSPDILERTRTARIEISPQVDSLNVATAAALVLHHIFTRKQQ